MKQGTLWRGLSSTVSTGPLLLSAACLLAACSTTNSQTDRGTQTIRFAPRALAKNLSPSDYYPDASLRAGETGEVILHFHIGSDGIAQAPFVVDEATKAVPRLIEEAQKMLTDTHYESGERYRHEVTASVLLRSYPTAENCSRRRASIITTGSAFHQLIFGSLVFHCLKTVTRDRLLKVGKLAGGSNTIHR